MDKARRKVYILGNDHTNTLGLVQSAYLAGYTPVSYTWGLKTGIVSASRYSAGVYHFSSPQDCIDAIIESGKDLSYRVPILCACDTAAIMVEENRSRFNGKFVSQYSKTIPVSISQEKKLQVKYAEEAGFNVPGSFSLGQGEDFPAELPFDAPYIYKALKSIEGSKSDLTICDTKESLIEKVSFTLEKTPRVLIQYYIEHDYEISILGCATSGGEVIIPAVENKLYIFPKNVGLECLAEIRPLEDEQIRSAIKSLIKKIGYVGLFSVEMMHSKRDGKFYFTEINLRNDGANSFIRKYGINLPAIHLADLQGEDYKKMLVPEKVHPGFYIWEMHHFYSLLHGDINLVTWAKEIFLSKGALVFEVRDPMPFIRQFTFPIINKLKRIAGK